MLAALVAIALIMGLAAQAGAQQRAPAPVPDLQITPQQAEAALATIKDPQRRAAFIATLEALVKAGAARPGTPPPAAAGPASAAPAPAPAAAPAAAPSKPADAPATDALPAPLAPDGLGAQVVETSADLLRRGAAQLRNALDAVQSVPLLWGWIQVMAENSLAQDVLLDSGWRLALVCLLAFGAFQLVTRLLAPARHRLGAWASRIAEHVLAGNGGRTLAFGRVPPKALEGPEDDAKRRTTRPFAWLALPVLYLGHLVAELLPVGVFVLAGHVIAEAAIGGQSASKLLILAAVDATTICLAMLATSRALINNDPNLSLIRLSHRRVRAFRHWVFHLGLIIAVGYAVAEVGSLLGMPDAAYHLVTRFAGSIALGVVIVAIARQRRVISRLILPPTEAEGVMCTVRRWVAKAWFIAVLLLAAGAWMMWLLEDPRGLTRLVRALALTVVVLGITHLLRAALMGLVDRVGATASPASATGQLLLARLGVYRPRIGTLVSIVLYVAALVILLESYGLGTLSWLTTTSLGRRLMSAMGSLLFIVGFAVAIWEFASLMLDRYIRRLDRDANKGRLARIRTIAPLIRTTLIIAITVIAGLMILSEIGINIAPLLAGAGIIGIAIGFGSQKLVQDLINGLFLLLENAMQVGDVVKLGELSGVVESLSIRTVRLRGEDGSVYIIPFSNVTTVTNMTRDYGQAIVSVTVTHRADFEAVWQEMQDVVRGMREDEKWGPMVRDDLELTGLDGFGDAGYTIKGRILSTAFGKWGVVREFNRRIKRQFAAAGIEVPAPRREVVQPPAPPAPDAPAQITG